MTSICFIESCSFDGSIDKKGGQCDGNEEGDKHFDLDLDNRYCSNPPVDCRFCDILETLKHFGVAVVRD